MTGWTSFTKKIAVKSTVRDVYRAWATQEGIERWFLRRARYISNQGQTRNKEEFVGPGDKYTWHWHGYPDTIKEENDVISANDTDRFQFIFTGSCLVTVALSALGDQTLVSVTQQDIPADNNPATNLLVGCGEGWTFYLANLKSVLEGGIDLRNKDESLQGVINS